MKFSHQFFLNYFIAISLNPQNVLEKAMNSLITADGKPTPALIEEIKSQMKEMELKKGSTEIMPDEFKDLVKESQQQQTLIQVSSAESSRFKNMIPLVNQAVVYIGAILPSVKASKEHKRNHDLSEALLVQTISEAAGSPAISATAANIEKFLPTADDMLDAMLKVGNVLGGKDGFNPIKMMSNIVGEKEMKQSIDDIMHFPLRFPDLTESQLITAEQVMLSVGLGFESQEQAIERFISCLNVQQRSLVLTIQKVRTCGNFIYYSMCWIY
jgi:hypothetical protein